MIQIFWPAIGVSVLASMILGFLWYGPIFGKPWARLVGHDMTQQPPTSQLLKSMLLMLIGCFLMAYTLAHNIEAWRSLMSAMMASGKMPGMQPSHIPVGLTINSALWTTIGYILPIYLSQVAFEKRSWKLLMINVGYYLVSLGITSAVMAYWVKTI